MSHPNLRRSRAAALGASLLAAAALLVPAAVTAQSLPETVTVSWLLPATPQVDLDVTNATPTNLADLFPQTYVAQIDGAGLGSEALLPECGVVQEDVYLLSTQKDADLLASLEANGLTWSDGQPADASIVQSWIFESGGDCQSSSPTPSGSAEASSGTPTPTGSAEAASGTPGVTPPATSTDGSTGGSGDGALLFVLALMAVGTTGLLVLAPSPVRRRRR